MKETAKPKAKEMQQLADETVIPKYSEFSLMLKSVFINSYWKIKTNDFS